MGTQLPLSKGATAPPPVFGPFPFWPNGWMHQDATWCIKTPLVMEVGLGPGHIVQDGDPAPPQKKGAQPPIFGPCLLWPSGLMDPDATWYGGKPRPRRQKKVHRPQFLAHVYCGQTAVCIRIPLGMEVVLSLGDSVGWGPISLSLKRAQSPNFQPMSVVAKWLAALRCHLVWWQALAQVTLC